MPPSARGVMWSMSMVSVGVRGWWQMPQWVVVLRMWVRVVRQARVLPLRRVVAYPCRVMGMGKPACGGLLGAAVPSWWAAPRGSEMPGRWVAGVLRVECDGCVGWCGCG